MRGRTSAHRRDGNHHALSRIAAQCGAYVLDTSQLGRGAPDLMVYTGQRGWMAVEIKAGKGKLRLKQLALRAVVPVHVWRTEADVLSALGLA